MGHQNNALRAHHSPGYHGGVLSSGPLHLHHRTFGIPIPNLGNQQSAKAVFADELYGATRDCLGLGEHVALDMGAGWCVRLCAECDPQIREVGVSLWLTHDSLLGEGDSQRLRLKMKCAARHGALSKTKYGMYLPWLN